MIVLVRDTSLALNQVDGPSPTGCFPHKTVTNSGVSDTSLYNHHLQRRLEKEPTTLCGSKPSSEQSGKPVNTVQVCLEQV